MQKMARNSRSHQIVLGKNTHISRTKLPQQFFAGIMSNESDIHRGMCPPFQLDEFMKKQIAYNFIYSLIIIEESAVGYKRKIQISL